MLHIRVGLHLAKLNLFKNIFVCERGIDAIVKFVSHLLRNKALGIREDKSKLQVLCNCHRSCSWGSTTLFCNVEAPYNHLGTGLGSFLQ